MMARLQIFFLIMIILLPAVLQAQPHATETSQEALKTLIAYRTDLKLAGTVLGMAAPQRPSDNDLQVALATTRYMLHHCDWILTTMWLQADLEERRFIEVQLRIHTQLARLPLTPEPIIEIMRHAVALFHTPPSSVTPVPFETAMGAILDSATWFSIQLARGGFADQQVALIKLKASIKAMQAQLHSLSLISPDFQIAVSSHRYALDEYESQQHRVLTAAEKKQRRDNMLNANFALSKVMRSLNEWHAEVMSALNALGVAAAPSLAVQQAEEEKSAHTTRAQYAHLLQLPTNELLKRFFIDLDNTAQHEVLSQRQEQITLALDAMRDAIYQGPGTLNSMAKSVEKQMVEKIRDFGFVPLPSPQVDLYSMCNTLGEALGMALQSLQIVLRFEQKRENIPKITQRLLYPLIITVGNILLTTHDVRAQQLIFKAAGIDNNVSTPQHFWQLYRMLITAANGPDLSQRLAQLEHHTVMLPAAPTHTPEMKLVMLLHQNNRTEFANGGMQFKTFGLDEMSQAVDTFVPSLLQLARYSTLLPVTDPVALALAPLQRYALP